MTREELIRMGAASGLSFYGMGKDRERFIAHMQRFANMVLAVQPVPGPDSAKVKLFIDRMKVMAAADEREAILDLVDSYAKNNTDLADAIRARGNT